VAHSIDYTNFTRDKAWAPKRVVCPRGLAETPLVRIDLHLLQERWHVHPLPLNSPWFMSLNESHLWSLKKLNLKLKWTLAEKHALYGWHVPYSSLAPVCLWTYIFRKACYLSCWCLRYGMIKWTSLRSVQSTWDIYLEKQRSSQLLNLMPLSYQSHMSIFLKNLYTYAACYHVELCPIVVNIVDTLHTSMIKITYTPLPQTRLLH
jgi:hypothetical protein